MKLGTKILVTLSAAALALVGWAVPAALAGGSDGSSTDNTNKESYWLDQYDNAISCYKATGNSGHGSLANDAEGNPGVKLVEFNQAWDGDRWEVLIVKGGNGYNEYPLPNANEVYHAPDNASGKPADVSHWIVCKGSQEQQTFTPECKTMTFEFPGSTKDAHFNVQISPRGADAGKGDITLNFHNSDDSWGNPYTATYADHANWPGWAEYAVVWVQVSDQNYHWSGELTCGEPEEEVEEDVFICVWDAANDESVKTKVGAATGDDILWADGIDCGPGDATYCFSDGNGGFVEETVRDDADFPLGDPVESSKCVFEEYKTYVCWEITADDFDTNGNGQPIANGKLFDPKQEFVLEGDSYADLNDCWDIVAECGTITWFQLDEYVVKTEEDHALLQELKENGLGWNGQSAYDGHLVKSWKFKSAVGDECEEPPVFICVWDANTDTSVKTEVPAATGDDILWTEGVDCGPDEATYCFADGNGGFVNETVRDDGDFPLGEPVPAEDCVLEEVEYDICEWDAETDTSVKVTVDELTAGDIEWVDGIDCGPGEATYCFADGNGGFVEQTVRDDADFPLGDPVPGENCVLDVVEYDICEWDAQTDTSVKVTVTEQNEGDIQWVDGIDCGPSEATYCFEDGNGGFVEETVRDDDDFPLGQPVDAENCLIDETEYFVCVWDDELEIAVKTQVDNIGPTQTPWFDGTECTEEEESDVVDICVVNEDDDTATKETIDESDLTEDMILWEDEMATEGCTDDFTIVLGAPPLKAPAATPVVAVATYAG